MKTDRRTFLAILPVAVAALAAPAQALQVRRMPIRVYKTPTCGCCSGWVEHLRAAGFAPTVENHEDLTPIARRLGVPDRLRGCHSAQIGGFFVEGHVPAADIRRLLAARPAGALGIAVPGMPVGSPGMEHGNRRQPYQVILVRRGGATSIFARHG